MAIPAIEMPTATATSVIDLRGHRLGELVQALTGCTTESAELAVGDLSPGARVDEHDALDVMAAAMVRLRRQRNRAHLGRAVTDR